MTSFPDSLGTFFDFVKFLDDFAGRDKVFLGVKTTARYSRNSTASALGCKELRG